MKLLIEKQDLTDLNLDIAPGVKEPLIKRCIHEAQEFDLQQALESSTLYLDLLNQDFTKDDDGSYSALESKYARIWTEWTYTYNSIKYRHIGIKTALCYWSYARYLAESPIVATRYGIVNKTNDYSNHLEKSALKELIAKYKTQGAVVMDNVQRFMDRNLKSYNEFYTDETNTTNFKISSFRKETIRDNDDLIYYDDSYEHNN